MTQADVLTDQTGHVTVVRREYIIERMENGMKLFFSERIGRDFGNPAGAWATDRKAATPFTKVEAENLLTHIFTDSAPFCKVVTL